MTSSRRSCLLLGLLATLALAPGVPAQEIRLGSEFLVNTETVNAQRRPRVASDAGGGFVVVWESFIQDGSSYGIFARRFSSAGAALATEFQVNTNTVEGQYEASVAVDADGDFVVAWTSPGDGDSYGIFARRFTSAGVAFATELQVNVYTLDRQSAPSVASDADGDFVVAWQGLGDGNGYGIFARRFTSAGAAQASEFQVNAYITNSQYRAAVASDAQGDFVVAWESQLQDGNGYGVFGRSFSRSGPALATEFQVNTHTTSRQYRASVASAAGGAFVVAWESQVQDGSLYGIFGQRFARPRILDVDGDGSFGALTDGLLVLRYAFGFRNATLVTGVVNLAGCTRCDVAAIESYLAGLD